MIAFGGSYPTTVIPSTVVLDREHRVAAVFLRELLAEDLQPVVERLACREGPGAMTLDQHRPADGHRSAAAGRSVSALAGLVSFASPCVVPLVPGYLSYLAAVVGVDGNPAAATGAVAVRGARLRVAGAAALFVAGFTVVFVLGTVAVLGMTTDADHQSGAAATDRRGGHHPDGPGVHRPGPGAAARHPVHPAAAVHAGRCPAARCGVRPGLDAVPGADAGRGDRRGLGDRGHQRGARRAAGRRLLPRAGNAVRAAGFRFGAGGAGVGWLRRHTRAHPDLRRRAADPGGCRAGDRGVERVRRPGCATRSSAT